jgi:uncharacterized protein YutE (UPF0331/DUF86 family)
MTVRPQVILARLAHLGRVLEQLRRLRALPSAERMADPMFALALERALHVAAEALFDIGHHVLAGRGRAIPATYREIVPALVQEGVLPADLGVRLEGLAGLRNILVHDYVAVDTARLWEAVDARLPDLEAVEAALARLPELGPRG